LELHINDLSVDGQFTDAHNFRENLQPLLEFRAKYPALSQRMFCSRLFSDRPATPTQTVQAAVVATHDRTYIGLVLRWLTGSGPFWDDSRAENPDDYFHFEGNDVTLQGMGEAARRRILGVEAGTFSFTGNTTRFAQTPLNVRRAGMLWTTSALRTISRMRCLFTLRQTRKPSCAMD